jgi:uncharacterized membrane protein YccC
MNFPEIVTWASNLVTLLQLVGGALIGICIAILALMLITSFGNEDKVAFVRIAAVTLVLGLFLLVAAPRLATVLQGLVSFMNPPVNSTPTPTPTK